MERYPIDWIRSKFPSLAITDGAAPRVYLDNPAGTQVPQSVANAAARALIETNANLGGYFVTSRAAESIVEGAHRAMATFLNANSFREIVIAQSMTNLTFHLSRCIGRTLRAGDEIVVTRMDHDGNISPWLALAEDLGLTVRWLPFDLDSWIIEPAMLESVLTDRTRLLALNYASNLTGSVNDVKTLTRLAKARGALVYVDAVQYAPHGVIDVQDLGCDFLACSSYKFFGPHLGILWGREELLAGLYPYKVRPQTDETPWRFETGTPQIELQAALTATIEYFAALGGAENGIERSAVVAAFDRTVPWERALTVQLVRGLKQLDGVTIYGITSEDRFDGRVPTVSFRHAERAPTEIAASLAEQNIFVWSGNNFALEVVRAIGADETEGVVRIGMAHYNSAEEIERVLDALS